MILLFPFFSNLIFNNLLTLKNEQDVSQGVLDRHTSKLKSKYPLAFRHPDTAEDAERALSDWSSVPESSVETVGINHSPQLVVSPASHPQTQQAIDWANSHPNDPRAKVILQGVGAEKNAGL